MSYMYLTTYILACLPHTVLLAYSVLALFPLPLIDTFIPTPPYPTTPYLYISMLPNY